MRRLDLMRVFGVGLARELGASGSEWRREIPGLRLADPPIKGVSGLSIDSHEETLMNTNPYYQRTIPCDTPASPQKGSRDP